MDDDIGRGLGKSLLLGDEVAGLSGQRFALPTGTVTFLFTDVEGFRLVVGRTRTNR
jgi:hypothetical protein